MDADFGAISYTKSAWPGTSLAMSDYSANKLKQALEQAIYSAHTRRHNSPISQILLLPKWEHNPYLARNLHTSYVQKLTSIPYYLTSAPTLNTRKPKLNIYLVSNERALALLDRTPILSTLREAITNLLGKPSTTISLNLHNKDPPHIDNNTSYTDPYPDIPDSTRNPTKHPIRPFHAAWNPYDFIYTDGSQKAENPTLGASVVNPHTQITTHIEIKSQPERHTINRAELAAITVALDPHKHLPQIRILTDNAFCINTLRNYAIDPLNFTRHPHKDLLHYASHTRTTVREHSSFSA